MNNYELPVAASSTEEAAKIRMYDYQSAWNSSPENLLQNDVGFHNGRGSVAMKLECSDSARVHELLPGTETVNVQSKVNRLDLGMWLLCGSVTRQNHWDCLLRTPQNGSESHAYYRERSSNLKRMCDVASSFLLMIALFPLFIIIAIAIKLDTRGPVLFCHSRIGKDGKEFVLWKFRSMKVDVPNYAVSPQTSTDTRLTRIGRLIRRLSIDELPQLINVFKGEMSLVGPRPEMPFIVRLYSPAQHERFIVKPGITGLWQISPARALPIHETIQYDLHYIRNQNVLLDCAILLRTVTAVIHGVGAV